MKLTHNLNQRAAFTLIELLAVITIIGILAGLVIGVAGLAGTKKKIALVEAQKQHLVAVIEAYHDKMGCYPPDAVLRNDQTTANTNLLVYELTGCKTEVVSGKRRFVDVNVTSTNITSDELKNFLGKSGIINAAPADKEPQNFYKMALKPAQYTTYDSTYNVKGLLVPVDLESGKPNFWYYDSSSTNRHNPDSFDLWAVFKAGKETITNGNW